MKRFSLFKRLLWFALCLLLLLGLFSFKYGIFVNPTSVHIRGHILGILDRADLMLQNECGRRFYKSISVGDTWTDVTQQFEQFVDCYESAIDVEFQARRDGKVVDDLGRPMLIKARESEGRLWLQVTSGVTSPAGRSEAFVSLERSYPRQAIGSMATDVDE